ncbi:alanine racemase [Halovulum dunhuangense]|uniref:Alanine racemase n=1 Tax=Halovulum dunhuangense TaxID=1505036 RepID=A0A849L5W8_9RHOB|nr:alanine racemase [Halovulum dunhuangense]NNU81888.1 alanine racemase [Halovulum dunhuangense]
MTRAVLAIDLDAIAENWAALDARSAADVETAAVVKADGYGLGIGPVGRRLLRAGVRRFFVAQMAEGVALRAAIGDGPPIHVFAGYTGADRDDVENAALSPLLNSPEQIAAFSSDLKGRPCGLQIDSGMHRLGLAPEDDAAFRAALDRLDPDLVISHLACADTPEHPMNARQLETFARRTRGIPRARLSLAATGGILMGPEYHFGVTRPGVGLYGGLPFAGARGVVRLDLPVIQVRDVRRGDAVGYGATWTAPRPSRIATLSAGYADGLIRAIGGRVTLFAGDRPVPSVGRVSMDLMAADVTGIDPAPEFLTLIGPAQGVDGVAAAAGTIGYEILTGLGHRYERVYKGVD